MLDKAPSRNPDGVDALIARWQDNQDPAARDRLFRQYRPFVRKIAHDESRRYGFDVEEATQWASIGFLRAIDTYEPSSSALFGYSKLWMRSEIGRRMQGSSRGAITFGNGAVNDFWKVSRARRDLDRNGDEITVEALVTATRISAFRVKNALDAMAFKVQSTSTPLGSDEDGSGVTLGDTLAAMPATRPDVIAEETATLSAAREAIEEAAERVLSPRYWEVLRLRLYEELTLKQIGDRMGVTRERIRQIEAKAIPKLAEALAANEMVAELLDRS